MGILDCYGASSGLELSGARLTAASLQRLSVWMTFDGGPIESSEAGVDAPLSVLKVRFERTGASAAILNCS
jgi:hypothetical protein